MKVCFGRPVGEMTKVLNRVAASFVSDVEVAAELDAKSQSEVESGKASEVPLGGSTQALRRDATFFQLTKVGGGRTTVGCVKCAVLMTSLRLSSMQLQHQVSPFTMTR